MCKYHRVCTIPGSVFRHVILILLILPQRRRVVLSSLYLSLLSCDPQYENMLRFREEASVFHVQ